jgi:hypothetical protein
MDTGTSFVLQQLQEVQAKLQKQIDFLKQSRKRLESDVARLQANTLAISRILVERGIATEVEIDRLAAEALESLRSVPVAPTESLAPGTGDDAAQEVYKELGL